MSEPIKFVEGAFIETKKGKHYLLLINDGHYAGIVAALRLYDGPWYIIRTDGLEGTEKDVLNLVTDENRVQMIPKWKTINLTFLEIIDRYNNVILTSDDIRIFQWRIYEI